MKRILFLSIFLISLLCVGVAPINTARAATQFTSRAPEAAPEIALTFDDGPNPVFTPQILHILDDYGVKATFFCLGEEAQKYPELVQQIQQAGDAVGVHGWDHTALTKLSPDEVDQQLRSTSDVIQQATGTAPTVFRPPYGSTDQTVVDVASTLGLTQVLWSVDTEDWQRPGTEAIVNAALMHAHAGGVILMHDGGGDRSETVAALPQIITALQQRGFTFVTL
jgi:peptidoglycan/xylan/chitin deacetylase (PgdA/CDA1 family)